MFFFIGTLSVVCVHRLQIPLMFSLQDDDRDSLCEKFPKERNEVY